MRTLRRALRLPSARLSAVVLVVVAVAAVFGHWLAPLDPLAQDSAHVLSGPSAGHLLGTDGLGRDVLSRLVAGTSSSIVATLEAVGTALLVGIVLGIGSLWLGRGYEWASLRFVDSLQTLPYVVFVVAVVGVLGNGLTQAMLAIGLLYSPIFFRVSRAASLALLRAQYVEAAELFGATRLWILRTHLWSKILPTIAVTAAQASAECLLAVQSLSFLGIGVQPPAPTWGGMLADDLGFLAQQPWAPLIPAITIMITVGALNAIADAISDSADLLVVDASPPQPGSAQEVSDAAVAVR
ncbi:ABC transporter permease [Actinoallomurus purpureus]|uniref:ABC transporter permease n=1 Tax=Actinoallomurus purpureus TaxID=478114 RepID=UPI002093F9CD|nr:ABC transporter permease [Actinoallomurus purpureus]MCO6008094.1 ABC transporter permease [Actinoallomurus purpureus]